MLNSFQHLFFRLLWTPIPTSPDGVTTNCL